MNAPSKSIIFFVDRCLGKQPILEKLRSTGVTVEAHDDHFPQNAQDVHWLPVIGARGWVILTKDARIARNSLERRAVAYAGIKMFTLALQQLSGEETALAFHRALSGMLKFVEKNPAPFIAKVFKDGKVKPWKTATDLLAEIQIFVQKSD